MKRIFVFISFILCGCLLFSACGGTNSETSGNAVDYSFLKGTWRYTGLMNTHCDVWFSSDQSTFKYLYQNSVGDVQRYEGSVDITKNDVTNQITIRLSAGFTFVVLSDEYGKTYLQDTNGDRYYKV